MNTSFDNIKQKLTSGRLLQILKESAALPYICILLVLYSTFRIYPSGDDQNLLNGLSNAFSCFAKTPIPFPCYSLHFPIFQYLIATPFKIAGFRDPSIIEVFGYFNLAWSFVAAAAFWRVGVISANRPGGHLALMFLLSGYLIWYMTSAFNEAAAFALFALLALSVIDKWRIGFVCLIAFGCTITKEVAFPFVLYFMFLALLAREVRQGGALSLVRRATQFVVEYKFAIAGVMAGVILNHSFNYFRFGSIANLTNLDPILFNPWEYVPVFLLYLFISPTCGLFFTWFSMATLFIAQAVFLARDRSMLLISALTLLGLIAANFGLARWYSSFGMNAWGPRLTLPFLGAVGILGIYLVAPQIIKYFRRIKYGAIFIFLIIAASSLPNFAARLEIGTFNSRIFTLSKVAIDSGIPNFNVQTAPVPLYQKAAIEGISRNIIIPTTVEIVQRHLGIAFLWLFSILYICTRFIIIPDKVGFNTYRLGPLQKAALILIAFLSIVAFALDTRLHRDTCPKCFDFWQKYSLGEVSSYYHLSGSQENLVKGLVGFPSSLPLATVAIELKYSAPLKSINIGAIGKKDANVGNWTTQSISYLWGIGILDNATGSTLINNGDRREELNIPIDRKLTLLIPDNGNLSKCPDLYIQLTYMNGKHARTLAGCK